VFFDRILNLEEASQVAGLSASRLRWLAERGRFPSARRIGKGWAVLESDVRDFLERERRPGKPWLLRGNWLFQRLPADRQHWLVYRSKSLLCEPTGEGFDLAFIGLANESWVLGVPATEWVSLITALEQWASTVEALRRVPVDRRWTSDPIDQRETLAEVDPDGMLDPAAYPGVAMPELSSANRWVNLVGRGVAVIGLVNGAWQRVPVISRDLAAGWIEVQWPAMDYAIGPGRTVPLDVPRLRLGPDQYQEITTA
jgi:predicted DNA-binding transcriptional regulator AlpA